MKYHIGDGRTGGGGGPRIAPERAAEQLRKRIVGRLGLRHLRHLGWLAWRFIRTFVYWAIFVVIVALAFWPASRHEGTLTVMFLSGTGLLLAWTYLDIRKRFNIRIFREKQSGILIGKSYGHFTESLDRSSGPMEVGEDGPRRIDYLKEPNPHVLILGSTSSGKTTTMRSFISRVAASDSVPFLILDWNGDNEQWAQEANATLWRVPESFKVNLFRFNGLGKEARASIAIESLAIAARLTALQATRVKSTLLKFYMDGKEPSLYELWYALCSKDVGKSNVLNQRLRGVQRVIGTEPNEFWGMVFQRNSVVSLKGLNESEKSLVAYSILQRLTELFDREQWAGDRPRLVVVIDEAWQLFRKANDYEAGKETVAERIVRLGRKYGVGIVVSTQQLEDVPKVFVNSSSLLMIHQHMESSYYGRDLLRLNNYENAYMRNAAQGEMLLFDRGEAQKGKWWSDYLKVAPLSGSEISTLAGRYAKYEPSKIQEAEMPIEMHDSSAVPKEAGKPGITEIPGRLDMPAVVVYRLLVALARTGNKRMAHDLIKAKKWVVGDATIYGGTGKPSLIERAKNGGYLNEKNGFTQRGMKIIDPLKLIEKQGILSGSEEHKELMRKTIVMIQDRGNYAFTIEDKDGFDIGEIKAKTRNAWDHCFTIYECQTNAMKSEIDKCVRRAQRYNAGIVFVVPSEKVGKEIKEIGNEYDCIVI